MRLARLFLSLVIIVVPNIFAENRIPLFTFEVCNEGDADIYYVYDAKEENDAMYSTLVVNSFHEEYRKYDPKRFRPTFETQKHVIDWLAKVWKDERTEQKKRESVKLLEVRNQGKFVAILAIEINPEGIDRTNLDKCKHKEIMHIRLIAHKNQSQRIPVLPNLIDATRKHFLPNCDCIVYDTRVLNSLNMKLFKGFLKFKVVCRPFDKTLEPQGKYIGLMKEIKK